MTKLPKKAIPFYPFLIAVNSVLTPLANNINEVPLLQTIRPLAVSVLITSLLIVALYYLTRNIQRAALITTLYIILLFYYGLIFDNKWISFWLPAILIGTLAGPGSGITLKIPYC